MVIHIGPTCCISCKFIFLTRCAKEDTTTTSSAQIIHLCEFSQYISVSALMAAETTLSFLRIQSWLSGQLINLVARSGNSRFRKQKFSSVCCSKHLALLISTIVQPRELISEVSWLSPWVDETDSRTFTFWPLDFAPLSVAAPLWMEMPEAACSGTSDWTKFDTVADSQYLYGGWTAICGELLACSKPLIQPRAEDASSAASQKNWRIETNAGALSQKGQEQWLAFSKTENSWEHVDRCCPWRLLNFHPQTAEARTHWLKALTHTRTF